eukprot:TRINITY_DN1414_c0_g1_i1.p1 TRINITY_DN1414_c0_g1~~TRINITY_DN1414_c0_g1_i1.p1  ORF type:complete len:97 (-),score=12.88 TRINITY_DN1414_c0_g1_i1:258-506(-)
MLHFIQNVLFHMLIEVIEPNWHQFESQLRTARTVDGLITLHDKFLMKSLKACLLMNPDHLEQMTVLMNLCSEFSSMMQKLYG